MENQSVRAGLRFYGTIGPACDDGETLTAMLAAGMNGVRVNLSHGTVKAQRRRFELLADVRRAFPDLELLIDLCGPEIRIGEISRPMELHPGVRVEMGPSSAIPLASEIAALLLPGMELGLDDGLIRLLVERRRGKGALCRVIRGGVLEGRKSVALPEEADLRALPALTKQDLENLREGAQYQVRGVMQPFVRGEQDVRALRRHMDACGLQNARILAKIENRAGIANLKEIARACDEIVIARGDLGMHVPLHTLPGVQRQIAGQCKALGVPFLVVTQMLESMKASAQPTRAEVGDIANAVWQGASSLMLTGETAQGKYPREAMEMLVHTAREARRELPYKAD